jgi:hypothetical protein
MEAELLQRLRPRLERLLGVQERRLQMKPVRFEKFHRSFDQSSEHVTIAKICD